MLRLVPEEFCSYRSLRSWFLWVGFLDCINFKLCRSEKLLLGGKIDVMAEHRRTFSSISYINSIWWERRLKSIFTMIPLIGFFCSRKIRVFVDLMESVLVPLCCECEAQPWPLCRFIIWKRFSSARIPPKIYGPLLASFSILLSFLFKCTNCR